MKLFLLADIHGSLAHLPALIHRLREADLLLLAGDLTHFGDGSAARAVVDPLIAVGPPVAAVTGNCDGSDVEVALRETGIGVHGTCQSAGGLDVVGVGGSLPCPGSTPNELGESRFAAHLSQALSVRGVSDRPLVLLSHQPAYGTDLDRIAGGGHAGSTALRDVILRQRPRLAVSGHIHEARGSDRLGETVLVNPGAFRDGWFGMATLEDDRVDVVIERLA